MFERILVIFIGSLALAACLAILIVCFSASAITQVILPSLSRLLRNILTRAVWILRIVGTVVVVLSIPATILLRILSYRPDWVVYTELSLLFLATLVSAGAIIVFTRQKASQKQTHN